MSFWIKPLLSRPKKYFWEDKIYAYKSICSIVVLMEKFFEEKIYAYKSIYSIVMLMSLFKSKIKTLSIDLYAKIDTVNFNTLT
jgi:hypothetical protein